MTFPRRHEVSGLFNGFFVRMLIGSLVALGLSLLTMVPLAVMAALFGLGEEDWFAVVRKTLITGIFLAVQMYYWGVWSAFCSSSAALWAINGGSVWLYYPLGFIFCGCVAALFASKAGEDSGDFEQYRIITRVGPTITIFAMLTYVLFALMPYLMSPLYSWFLDLIY